MHARPFGSTGKNVPLIGQGTWNVPLRGNARDAAIAAIRDGIARGMTHLDTAEMYGDGGAEELLGEALAGLRRDELFVVSKVLPSNATYEGTLRACEQSLRRMRLDYLDCYLLHWRGNAHLPDTMRALEQLVADGKIRSLGVSNFAVDDLREASGLLKREKIACNQVLYHLEERSIEAHEIPYCREQGIAVVAYTPFGKGTWRDAKGRDAIAQVARKHGTGEQAVILAYLTHDAPVFAIPKATSAEHVAENAAAGDLQLDAADRAAIDAAFPARTRRGGLPTL